MTEAGDPANDGGRSVRRIMVATDFSDTARLALEQAATLARHHSAELVLIHSIVIEPIALGGPELMVLPAQFDDRVRDASGEVLSALTREMMERGLCARAELETGPAAQKIAAAARRLEADLLVVGTRGNTGFEHLLLGSVAEELVREAHCPVLTVHPGDTKTVETLRHILLPSDFSDDAERAVRVVSEVFEDRIERVHLTLLHVYQLPAMMAPLAGFTPEMPILVEDAREMAHAALDPLADALREKGFEVEVVGREGDPATLITQLACSSDVDLIAMGTRGLSRFKRILLGSTAARVVQHAACPVLTLRRDASRATDEADQK